MKGHCLTDKEIERFSNYLRDDEKSCNTLEKYIRDVIAFSKFCNGSITKDTVMASAKGKVEAMFDYKGVTVEPVEEEIKPTLFSFTIPQGTFDAEEGMTWSEWVNSEYNSTSLSVVGNEIGRDDGNGAGVYLYYKQNGKNVYVKPNELVDSSKYYQPEIRFPIIYF